MAEKARRVDVLNSVITRVATSGRNPTRRPARR
jgi:hypothetical protein